MGEVEAFVELDHLVETTGLAAVFVVPDDAVFLVVTEVVVLILGLAPLRNCDLERIAPARPTG